MHLIEFITAEQTKPSSPRCSWKERRKIPSVTMEKRSRRQFSAVMQAAVVRGDGRAAGN